MTAICIDKFKDTLYVLADGKVTEDDFVFTHTDKKITKLDTGAIITSCGNVNVFEQVKELYEEGRLSIENVRKLNGNGTVIIITPDNICVVDIDNESATLHNKTKDEGDSVNTGNKNGLAHFKLQSLPMFFGSGKMALSGGYYSLECPKSKDEKEYLQRMKRAFKATSNCITSVGPLYQVETIKTQQTK